MRSCCGADTVASGPDSYDGDEHDHDIRRRLAGPPHCPRKKIHQDASRCAEALCAPESLVRMSILLKKVGVGPKAGRVLGQDVSCVEESTGNLLSLQCYFFD
jgi:hypothetical protein